MSLVCSPRVVGCARPDCHSIEALVAHPRFAGRSGEALALALYDFLAGREDGTFHFWPSDERRGNPRTRRVAADPIPLLNAYGWTICGQEAALLAALYRAAGMTARQIGVPGHNLCEVFYDGGWHVLDTDMWTWFRSADGRIASACELARDPRGLVLENPRKSQPCNLPDRTLRGYADMYSSCETEGDAVKMVLPHWAHRGRTMDFRLRPGETLVRSTEPAGRFCMPRAWLDNMKKFPVEWKGRPVERYAPFRTIGNGRWIYEPDLTARAADAAAGAWERDGLSQDDRGLRGPGEIVFRIQSPYPFCGIPRVEGDAISVSDGARLELEGSGPVRVEVTDAEGEWRAIADLAGDFRSRADLTAPADTRYDFLVRLRLGAGARLSRFRFEGWILTAPLSLPRLVEGDNPMELRCGDRHGLCTVPWHEAVDFRAGADLAARWIAAENAAPAPDGADWQTIRPVGSGPLRVAYRFDAPAGRRFAWAHAHLSVREGPRAEPPRHARAEWSLDGRGWRPLAAIDVSNSPLQWDVSLDGEFRFPSPAGRAYVRVESGTPLSELEFHGHLAADSDASDPLLVTHRWREGDTEREFRAPPGERRYVIPCGPAPRGHTIEMRVPSRPG